MYKRQAQDRRTRIDRPNGTCTLYEYDEASRLSRLAHLKNSGEKVTPDLRYTRDAVGNVLSITDAGTPLWTYGYDRLDRLVRAVDHPGSRTWEWGYDPVGNRLSESLDGTVTRSSYNELNQLVQMGQTRFWYDLAGNLAHRAGPDGVSTYRFDSRERLVEVRTPQNQLVRYGYDAVGRLQTRKLDTDAKPTKFEWDGWDLVREVDPAGVETVYYAPLGEVLSFKRGGSVYQVHADALGSVRKITDPSGTSAATYQFGAWGGIVASSESSPLAGFGLRFQGALGVRSDSHAGLLYMRHRWYDHELSAFLSRDPLDMPDATYAYVENNPTTMTDVMGLAPWWDEPPWGPGPPPAKFPMELVPPIDHRLEGLAMLGSLGNLPLAAVQGITLKMAQDYGRQKSQELVSRYSKKGILPQNPEGAARVAALNARNNVEVLDDKFKHCVISCQIALAYGPLVADFAGRAFEAQATLRPGSAYDPLDIIANRLGVVFSRGCTTDEDCTTKCASHLGETYVWLQPGASQPQYPYPVAPPSDPIKF